MWQYPGRKKRTMRIPKIVRFASYRCSAPKLIPQQCRKKQPQLSSPIVRLPNELILQIYDYLERHEDKICLALTCRRLLQPVPALRLRLPRSVPKMWELTAQLSWPFYEDIAYKEENFLVCRRCKKAREIGEWRWKPGWGDSPSPMYFLRTQRGIHDQAYNRDKGYYPICRDCKDEDIRRALRRVKTLMPIEPPRWPAEKQG